MIISSDINNIHVCEATTTFPCADKIIMYKITKRHDVLIDKVCIKPVKNQTTVMLR